MRVQPAHVSQLLAAGDGFVEIAADVGMVAQDLARIDPALRVRFQPHCAEPFFAVYCQPDERTTYLVLTVKAYQGATGAWLGLDQRVVREFERIGATGYDYVGEIDAQRVKMDRAQKDRITESLEQAGRDGWELLSRLRGRNCGHMSVGSLPPAV